MIRIFQKLYQLGASNFVSLYRIISRLPGEKIKKNDLLPYAYLDIENLISQKSFKARSFKLDQLIQLIEDKE